MHKNKHGYVPAAIMYNKLIKQMRDHVEHEKFICRTIVDNETTQQFKKNTEELTDSKYKFMYNSETVNNHTEQGRIANANRKQTT